MNASSVKCQLFLIRVEGCAGAFLSDHQARLRIQPGQLVSFTAGHILLTPQGNLEFPVSLLCMSFDCGRKLETCRKPTQAGKTPHSLVPRGKNLFFLFWTNDQTPILVILIFYFYFIGSMFLVAVQVT